MYGPQQSESGLVCSVTVITVGNPVEGCKELIPVPTFTKCPKFLGLGRPEVSDVPTRSLSPKPSRRLSDQLFCGL